ncbi:flagellar hook protein FlgE [Laribacter hongkongensis]|uniref:flagellar hook protein FlgE n=1 Tax=Laribacter hongkongensis TaxID=168471 RepID=UPI001EFC94BA|nr:flagellar hook protein FlgE [Laribacter hongkongensis]MCG9114411.1 flagellar hook protein FlgE [Laribacter hongkongensis]
MAFQHGLSGINAASKQLDAIGNNVANSSTVGFKGSRAEFADMFAANFYGVAATQNGIGVNTTLIAQQFGQGNITTTGNQLDMAISGNGFFIMQNANGISYTRNGQFQIDREGYINNNGDYLMGWAVDDSTSPSTIQNGNLQPLRVDNSLLEPRPSDFPKGAGIIGIDINVDSRASAFKLPTTTGTYDSTGPSIDFNGTLYELDNALTPPSFTGMLVNPTPPLPNDVSVVVNDAGGANWTVNITKDGTVKATENKIPDFDPSDPKTYNHTTSLVAYDSLGNPINISTYYRKTDDNKWNVYGYATLPDGSKKNIMGTATPATPLGTIEFSNDGKIDLGKTTLPFNVTPAFDAGLGGDPLELKFDFSGTTQFGTNFAVNSLTQPGYASAVVTNMVIDKTGIVSAKYSNGQHKIIGQVVLANFANQQGLQPIGNNRWIETYASGTPTRNDPGSTNVGLIQSQALEDSNVDLTGELVNMITAQRYYQANAQTIKVHDQVLQSLMQMR